MPSFETKSADLAAYLAEVDLLVIAEALKRYLDQAYPEDLFIGSSGDPGPAAIRDLRVIVCENLGPYIKARMEKGGE